MWHNVVPMWFVSVLVYGANAELLPRASGTAGTDDVADVNGVLLLDAVDEDGDLAHARVISAISVYLITKYFNR